jgi:hypothetical protein
MFNVAPIVGRDGRNSCRGSGLSKRPDKAKKEVNPKMMLRRCMVKNLTQVMHHEAVIQARSSTTIFISFVSFASPALAANSTVSFGGQAKETIDLKIVVLLRGNRK